MHASVDKNLLSEKICSTLGSIMDSLSYSIQEEEISNYLRYQLSTVIGNICHVFKVILLMWRVRVYIVKSVPLFEDHSRLVMLHSLKEYPLKKQVSQRVPCSFHSEKHMAVCLVGEEQLHHALQILPSSFWNVCSVTAVSKGCGKGLPPGPGTCPFSTHRTGLRALRLKARSAAAGEDGWCYPSLPASLVLSGVRTELNWHSRFPSLPGTDRHPRPSRHASDPSMSSDFAV